MLCVDALQDHLTIHTSPITTFLSEDLFLLSWVR